MFVFQTILAFLYMVTEALHHTDSSLKNTLMPRQLWASLYSVFQSITQVSDAPVLLEQKQRQSVAYRECNHCFLTER